MMAALITAGAHITTNVSTGTIFALTPRPNPNAPRRLYQVSASTISGRPSRWPWKARYPMLWITPALSVDIGGSLRLVGNGLAADVAEQFLKPVPALLQPVERQLEIGEHVPHGVMVGVVGQLDEQAALVGDRRQPSHSEFGCQQGTAIVDLDQQELTRPGDRADRVGAQQLAAIQRDQVVADLLDLAEQVRGDQDRDAEFRADPGDQVKHRRAPGRVEPVGGLVEQQQPGVA